MHDVISDVLADTTIPRGRKRAEILLAARRYRDDTTAVMSVAEWREMAVAMGIAEQGGSAVGLMDTAPAAMPPAPAGGHAGHIPRAGQTPARDTGTVAGPEARTAEPVVEMLMALLEDATIRARIASDPALRRATERAIRALPSEHRDHLMAMLGPPPAPSLPDTSRSRPHTHESRTP
jgi:hypothetical protein